MRKRALITGIAGQDGSYLAELLLEKGYDVHGMEPRLDSQSLGLIAHLGDRVHLHQGDLADAGSVHALVSSLKPDEIYNLAAQSFVPASWSDPVPSAEVTAIGVTRLLDAVRRHAPEARLFQASSAELFGSPRDVPQTEDTPICPRTPYGAAKAYGHFMVRTYREAFGMFAATGILYNHESPRRRPEFVFRKVTQAATRIKLGLQDKLPMGSLEARRDWGFAGDYARAMWLILQNDSADDYVLATGQTHSVQELCQLAFECVGLDWRQHVYVDPAFVRAIDGQQLVGDYSKAKDRLGWTPIIKFGELIELMVHSDLGLLRGSNTIVNG